MSRSSYQTLICERLSRHGLSVLLSDFCHPKQNHCWNNNHPPTSAVDSVQLVTYVNLSFANRYDDG
jgi:hypothetical protein